MTNRDISNLDQQATALADAIMSLLEQHARDGQDNSAIYLAGFASALGRLAADDDNLSGRAVGLVLDAADKLTHASRHTLP